MKENTKNFLANCSVWISLVGLFLGVILIVISIFGLGSRAVGAKLFTSSMSLLIAVFSFHITGTDSFEGGKYVGWVFLLVCLAILSTFFVYPGVEHVQGLLKSIGEDMQKYPNRM